ncbi:uncharacterized protein YALI1_F30314g [Yarrowia lipolytica]|uniref:Uncharacterized protein n=1 Tax=Yarrowia lipolytica TaxID=4952 RepID=A0A1D8NPM7_YARLL|nr:hypothetical protein YALI1_F30314g [Yarrowia lipolytica]
MKENVFVLGPIWPLKKIPSNLYIYIDTRDSQAATVVSPYDAVRTKNESMGELQLGGPNSELTTDIFEYSNWLGGCFWLPNGATPACLNAAKNGGY